MRNPSIETEKFPVRPATSTTDTDNNDLLFMTAELAALDAGPRRERALSVATELFKQTPDWVTFFREILGTDGAVRHLYPSTEMLADFEMTQEYYEIQQMLAALRGEDRSPTVSKEPTRVITVRMPLSLHSALKVESHDKRTSMNKLCISKLVQKIKPELVPAEI